MSRPRPLLLLASLLGSSPIYAQDPWTRVPALPTACYLENDTFNGRGDTPGDIFVAIDAVQVAIARQGDVNAALKKQLSSLDGATKQSRMMEFMTKNPAKAQAAMKGMSDPTAIRTVGAHSQRRDAFEAEYETIKASYTAEDHRILGPLIPATVWFGANRTMTDAQVMAGMEKFNAAYKELCAAWFPTGAFPAFLARLRSYLIETYIPAEEKVAEGMKTQLEMFGIEAGDYHSLGGMQAVLHYMRFAAKVFGMRQESPKAAPTAAPRPPLSR